MHIKLSEKQRSVHAKGRRWLSLLSASAIAYGSVLGVAQAQVAQSGHAPQLEEVTVTARKTTETAIATPVILTAVSAGELQKRAVSRIDDLSRVVPSLMTGEGGGTTQGGEIALRGIAGQDVNPLADQAVSFNIDGVPLALASVRRMGQMDMQQIEVLEGPQSLFYGKNSPGGIISIHTADPTPKFEAKGMAGYDFKAQEKRFDGYMAGPITDDLGGRVALYISSLNGWMKSGTPRDALLAPKHVDLPYYTEWAVRGTLKYDPGERFNARLKYTYSRYTGGGPNSTLEIANCTQGHPWFAAFYDDCKANGVSYRGDIGTSFAALDAQDFSNGVPYLHLQQALGSLEMNYNVTDQLQLSSVTGFFHAGQNNTENFVGTWAPQDALPSDNVYHITQYSEEVRLTSSFHGPLNFMAGGLYTDQNVQTGSLTLANALAPVRSNRYWVVQDGKAWSIFGQLKWNIIPTLELSGGARYSHERKNLPVVQSGNTPITQPIPDVVPPQRSATFTNTSPEVTLAWRPSGQLTVFGSYKQGFLSGGFNSSVLNIPGTPNTMKYDQEVVKGGEIGVKTFLLDRTLRANVSAYTYKISGLQVTTSVQPPPPAPPTAAQLVTNAAGVTIRGIEANVEYALPSVEGLTVRGAIDYNHARYDSYAAVCYRGQTIAAGCNGGIPVGGNFVSENLSGAQLVRAPDWTGSAGFTYTHDVGTSYKWGLSSDVRFSSSYYTDGSNNPYGRLGSYAKLDANINFGNIDDKWQVSLIGTNLTNRITWERSGTQVGSGSPAGNAGSLTGDITVNIDRTRMIMLQVSVKTGG